MIPSQKITTVAFAGAVTTILLWVLEAASSVEVPAAVAAAIVTVITAGLGYLVPETRPAPSAIGAIKAEQREATVLRRGGMVPEGSPPPPARVKDSPPPPPPPA
jgi:hypothetical protein